MPKPRKRNLLYRLFWSLTHTPEEWLRVAQWILLGLVLLGTLVAYGGYVAYGEPMLGLTKGLLLVTAVHALLATMRERRPLVRKEWLAPLPFVLWIALGLWLITPASSRGWLVFLPLLQAFAVYWLVCNSIRSSRDAHWVGGIVLTVVTVALMAGVFQFYLFPEWMVESTRARADSYAYGAGGFLMDPGNLGALLLLGIPLAAGFMRFGRYAGPVRILSGFLLFFFIFGLLVTTRIWGLAVGAVVILLLPFFIVERPKNRLRTYGWGALVVLVLAPMLWFGTKTVQERVEFYQSEAVEDELGAASREVALAAFGSRPLTGYGPGSFEDLWGRFTEGGVNGDSRYPVSLYGDLLAESGLVGLVLVVLPLGWLLGQGLIGWRRTPFFKLKKDVEERMKRTPRRHQRHQRRQRDRKQGRTPAAKVILGGVVLGLAGWLGYAFQDFGHRLPLILLLVMLLLAVLATRKQWAEHLATRPRDRQGVWIGLVPLLLVGFTALVGPARFHAQHLEYIAEERLAAALAEPERIFARPEIPLEVERLFTLAAELNGAQAGAWRGRGEAVLTRHHAELTSLQVLGEEARSHLETSMTFHARDWRSAFGLARAHIFAGNSGAGVAEALSAAMTLAPRRPGVWSLEAGRVLLMERNPEKGRTLLRRALEENPEYGPALRLMNQLEAGLLERTDGPERGELLLKLAKETDPELARPERIHGAGRLAEEELLQAIDLF